MIRWERANQLRQQQRHPTPTPLDTLEATLPAGQDTATQAIERATTTDIHTAVHQLDPSDRDLLIQRFGLDTDKPRTLDKLAEERSASASTIIRHVNTALNRLQQQPLIIQLREQTQPTHPSRPPEQDHEAQH